MTKTEDNLNVKVEVETKKQAEKILEDLGLTMDQAINLFLKQVVLTKEIPFHTHPTQLKNETIEGTEYSRSIFINPKNHKTYNTLEELEADLKNSK